jgi:outer membrane receptor protein involved in Fe transport
VGVAPVAADNHAPKSLRMRAKRPPGAHWSPVRWAKQIAQAQPTPDQPPPGSGQGTDPSPAGTEAPTEPSPSASGPPAAAPATAAQVEQAPALSDEDLARMAEQEARTEVITVTGSLIGRKEVDSPSPVSVVDREKLEAGGVTNVGDVLQKLPAQGNALNAQNNNGGDGSTRINLRSLGTNRTLVLLNGRRVVPSGLGADDSVDFGTLPMAMIERVEVLKDGASAIYGSDAVAGVVNVITRTSMNGTEANIYTATSQKQDGTNYDLSFVTGHSSNRGNITFSGGYQQQKPVMAGERDFARQTYTYDFNCTQGDAACRALFGSSSSPTGRINAMPNVGPPLHIPGCTPTEDNPYCTANAGGGFRSYELPSATSFGDNYNFQPLNYLFTPSTRVNLFSNGHYDITKNTHVFFEGQFNSRKSTQQLAEESVSTGLFDMQISAQSIYNPLGQDIVDYNRRLTEFGPRIADQGVNTTRMVVGVNGTIDDSVPVVKNWKWEGSYNYGRTDGTDSTRGNLILTRLANALGPSYRDASGEHCGTQGNPIEGCLPLDLLHPGSGNITPAVIDYLTFTGTTSGFNEQHTAQLTTSGKVVDLPNHGDVSIALGGDYRFERGGFQPDPLTATGDTTGNSARPTRGSYRTFEGFSELSIVPYAGGDVLKWVELNAAGRAYDYNTFGSGVTGKITGLVRTVGGVAVRGTFGNAFRAPNISELFAGQFDSFQQLEDPCDTKPPSAKGATVTLSQTAQEKCTAAGVPMGSTFGASQQRAKLGGNRDLQPERAIVGTAGVVYEPLKGADFTLDYWHVRINNAITNLPPAAILSQCYDAGIDDYCKLVERNANHGISHIVDPARNIGSLITSGLDFSAGYQYQNAAGTFRHSFEGTYLLQSNLDTGTIDPRTMKEQIIHGKGFFDLGTQPDLKFNIFTTWSHPSGLGAGFNVRFIDSFQECDNNDCNNPANGRRDVSKYVHGDLFVSYGLKTSQGTTRITAGVNNVTNVAPPAIYNGPVLNADESAYDFMGRQFYLRLSQLF